MKLPYFANEHMFFCQQKYVRFAIEIRKKAVF